MIMLWIVLQTITSCALQFQNKTILWVFLFNIHNHLMKMLLHSMLAEVLAYNIGTERLGMEDM